MNTDRARGKSQGRGTEDTIIKSTVEEEAQEQGSSSSSEASSSETSAGGRPSTIENPRRTTLTLEQRHIDNLRRIRAAIMGTGGEEISRSAAVRAVFDAIGGADLDYSEVETKEDLQNLIRKKLER